MMIHLCEDDGAISSEKLPEEIPMVVIQRGKDIAGLLVARISDIKDKVLDIKQHESVEGRAIVAAGFVEDKIISIVDGQLYFSEQVVEEDEGPELAAA